MGNQKWTEDYFSKALRAERERRGWSQARLAELLSDKGISSMHWTTVAKIEKGDRSVRIDEAAAVADLFEVSLDTLLGRSVPPKADEHYTLRTLIDTASQAAWQISAIRQSVRDGATVLSAFEPTETSVKRLVSECERVADTLEGAERTLWEALNTPEGFPAGKAQAPVTGRTKR